MRSLAFAILSVMLFAVDAARVSAADAAVFLVRKQALWKYFAEPANPPDNWYRVAFDDSAWKVGVAGFGYGDDDDRTVLCDMRGRYTSVRIRATFELEDPNEVESLYLYVNFDDGFVAYLNGTQIASAAITNRAGRRQVRLHEALNYEEFPIKNAARILKPGKNLIAIEGHNAAISSSDFSLDPFLTRQKLDSPISVTEYLADLDEFERRLLDQSSYLTRRGLDYEAALSRLRASINQQTQLAEFVAGLRKLVMRIGDCHASVSSGAWPASNRFLPLRPADTANAVAALAINRDQPLDLECPYIESIDRVRLVRWLTAASQFVPHGSPQLIRRGSLNWFGRVSLIRDELGLPAEDTVRIGLRSEDGSKRIEKRLRLTGQGYSLAQVRLRSSRQLDDNIAYLRIPAMDDRLVVSVVGHIRKFRDTAGMIIDVRDNGGGTYAILRAVYGFFVPEGTKPYVTNIAAYRLSSHFCEDHIAYRPTHRAAWAGWSNEQRAAIDRAAAAFKPEWLPAPGRFSKWHYMLLSREGAGSSRRLDRPVGRSTGEDVFYYDKPVVVLCNAGSFSATDGFLSAFADLPQVTLVGEPSGGGSGARRRFTLPNTRVRVALSSMASFRPNGKLFDGNGVEVDIHARPTLQDFTLDEDSVLQRGIAVLKQMSR